MSSPQARGAAVNWKLALGMLALPARLPPSQPVPSGPIFTEESPPFRGLPPLWVTGTLKFRECCLLRGVKTPSPHSDCSVGGPNSHLLSQGRGDPGLCTTEGGVWDELREGGLPPTWHPCSCRVGTLTASLSASPGTFQALNKDLLAE